MRDEMRSRAGRGFTLIEIMVAVGIIVILVAILVPVAASLRNSGKAAVAQATMRQIESSLELYVQSWNRLSKNSGRSETPRPGTPDNRDVIVKLPRALPPGCFDDAPAGKPVSNLNETWHAWLPEQDGASGQVDIFKIAGGALWGAPEDIPGLFPVNRQYVGEQIRANQALAYALTGDVGEGPFLKGLSDEIMVQGGFRPTLNFWGKKLVASAAYLGAGTYPGAPSTAKINLIDPWGNPYLYGWVIKQKPQKDEYEVREAVIASAGTDGMFSPNWIQDAQAHKQGKPVGAPDDPQGSLNVDNVVP